MLRTMALEHTWSWQSWLLATAMWTLSPCYSKGHWLGCLLLSSGAEWRQKFLRRNQHAHHFASFALSMERCGNPNMQIMQVIANVHWIAWNNPETLTTKHNPTLSNICHKSSQIHTNHRFWDIVLLHIIYIYLHVVWWCMMMYDVVWFVLIFIYVDIYIYIFFFYVHILLIYHEISLFEFVCFFKTTLCFLMFFF